MLIETSPAAPELLHRHALKGYLQEHHPRLEASRRRHRYFHQYMQRLIRQQVLPGSRVLDVGCGVGDVLASLEAKSGLGIDLNEKAIAEARSTYAQRPELEFQVGAIEELVKKPLQPFDYVIFSGVLDQLYDVHTALEAIRGYCHDRTRLIFCTFSRLWTPLLRAGEALGIKARIPDENWLPSDEMVNMLGQSDFEVVRQPQAILCPVRIPLLDTLLNRWIAPLPGFQQLGLCTMTIARMLPRINRQQPVESVSIVIPARNEAGHIRALLERIPPMAPRQEVIFVEGNSTDNTWQTIEEVVRDYRGPYQLQALRQTGKGKGDAVRLGFARCQGEILMILDADISVPPEELPRFVEVLARGQCEMANGSRLVYPMEKRAMRFLNMLANKTFGWLFSYLLGQPLRDTLCGTKVLRRSDYLRIAENRAYFGDFDPFGDFDLLFGAARLNLRIRDIPVHYKERVYGETNISRFRHGWMLLKMCAVAARKIKFI